MIQKIYAHNSGEALVGGYFKTVNGQEQSGLVRLDARGNMDPDFRPRFEPDPEDVQRPGPPFGLDPAKISIRTVYVQPDGRILVGGDFFSVNGTEIKPLGIVRLLESGELDGSFQITEYPFSTNPAFRPEAVSAIRFVEDKILISSHFTFFVDLNGAWVDGYRTSVGSGSNVSVDNQGRILVTRAGSRIGIQGITREASWRLLPDLGMDLDFEPVFYLDGLPTNRVSCNAVQRDGKILMAGAFEEFSGVPRNGLVRLNEDGSLDETFSPGGGIARTPYGGLTDVRIASNGTIYVLGEFDQFDGFSRQGIARLLGDPTLQFERPRREPSMFTVQARTVNGESYVWEYTESFKDPQWKTVLEFEGDGLFQTLEDPAVTGEMRMYRLRERVQ